MTNDPIDRTRRVRIAVSGGSVIFLDVAADRYFALPTHENELAVRLLEGRRLNEAETARLGASLGAATVEAIASDRLGSPSVVRPASSALDEPVVARGADVLVAVFALLRARLALRVLGLARVLFALDHPRSAATSATTAARIVSAHLAAGRWLSQHDRCLVRSIALAAALRRRGITATFVIGVKSPPFGAHSWVQMDSRVLNDTVERVAPFVPILVV